jgi:hypothetical protein
VVRRPRRRSGWRMKGAAMDIPYAIAAACSHLAIGVMAPLDRPWLRLHHDAAGNALAADDNILCCCGTRIPKLPAFVFTYSNGKTERYYVWQCTCQRIYWETD